MTTLPIMDREGGKIEMESKHIEALRASLRGTLLLEGDAAYNDSRSIWNAMIDRRPALVARPIGVSDIVACVNFARQHGISLSMKAGGHNIAGTAVTDG